MTQIVTLHECNSVFIIFAMHEALPMVNRVENKGQKVQNKGQKE